MLRNREILLFLLAAFILTLIAVMMTGSISSTAALLVLGQSAILIAGFLILTRWRYKEIEKLSGYLRRISNGDDTLDIRDNHEGELSILKNDIYKVTLMLSEHRKLLQQDKLELTNSISDISHQLKTPLTSMTVMADLLEDEQLPAEKRKEFTRNISGQLERIDWLVSSLLKLSKIDAGTITFKREKIMVAELIEKVLSPLRIPIELNEQTIRISGDPHASFVGDLNWTAEALINIVKNCVEHTEKGGEISFSYHENVLFTEISIIDNGKGIEKEDLPYIFKRFYKGKTAGEDSVGIGLAMAQSIISSQQGHIEVKSRTGEGTRFQIKFYK